MNARQTKRKINAIVDEVLDEKNNSRATQTETCPGGCEKLNDTPEEVSNTQKVSLLSQLF